MATQEELMRIREQKRSLYDARTRFMDDRGEPIYTNHLVQEDSPYLLQHAHNPVNWYPWGDEAFAKAAAENKPVFLSIGYSTCHWCHVMEEESFDDEEVGEVLNRHFVSIKVDREQRPDLDEIYMTCVQLLSGHGGWPMSSFLTPEAKPFFGATYFPKDQFISLLTRVNKIWMEDRPTLVRDAEKLDGLIRQQLDPASPAPLPDGLAEQVVEQLVQAVDRQYGGFGDAPKFPQEPNLLLLLEQVQRDPRPLDAQPAWSVLGKTLDAMLRGGIYDQVGGGFARYSTDRRWLVPHFEKMLYNQGQLAWIYLWAWQLSGEREYRRIVEETLDYLLREMRSTTGGFYSATDADSEGEEGKYFVWHYHELAELLSPEEMALCEAVYGVTRSGNFEGANILYLPRPLDQVAEFSGVDRAELDEALDGIKKRLYGARLQRVPPLRDNKQITEWNGMVVAALAQAGAAFHRQDYLDAAILAAEDLWLHHHEEDAGVLWRTSLSGTASIRAVLDDYAHFLNALIALYDATGEGLWLDRARSLTDELQAHYWDEDDGGFFVTARSTVGPQLIRSKNLMDGATVSGNSLILRVLIALYHRTGDLQLKPFIERQIQAFSGRVSQSPIAAPVFLQGLQEWAEPAPSPLQYAAGGAIRVRCRSESLGDSQKRLTFTLEMRSGWHVQAHQPTSKERVPTAVRILNPEDWQETKATYPEPENGPMGPGVTPELVYTGTVMIVLEATSKLSATVPLLIELQLQPCTETECLLPERRSFLLHV